MQSLSMLFSAAILVVVTSTANAKDLYVNASTGNDSTSYADNSASSPWRTLGRAVWGSASRNSQNSGQAARAGDTVFVEAGTYATSTATNQRHEPIYNPVNSGSSNAPITIQANGNVYLTSSSGGQPIIGTLNRSYIVWDGFILNEANIRTTADTGPLVVWSSHNVTIKNTHIIGQDQNWNDNHVGIRLEYSNDILIANNRIEGFNDSGMNSACIMTYDVYHSIFEHNECFDSVAGIFIKGDHSGDNHPQHDNIIRFNYIHDTMSAIQFGGIGSTTTSNTTPIMSYVYQNLIVDASLGGVVFIGYDGVTPSKVTVSNNTFHRVGSHSNNESGGILLRPGYSGYSQLYFHNNLVTNSGSGVAAWDTAFNNNRSATTFSHNNYYGNGASAYIAYNSHSLSSWQNTYSKDLTGTTTVNPQYLGPDDFRLSSNSPIQNAGLDVLDLDGDGSTTDSITIGAYITGDEVIGPTTEFTSSGFISNDPIPAAAPNPPSSIM